MTRIVKDRGWLCMSCSYVSTDADLLRAPSPFDPSAELTGCPNCRDCGEFRLLCDEPGCGREASGGWPTGDDSDAWGGYRQTCAEHYKPANAAP